MPKTKLVSYFYIHKTNQVYLEVEVFQTGSFVKGNLAEHQW